MEMILVEASNYDTCHHLANLKNGNKNMIKHIVVWKLKDHAEGKTKHENALQLKTELESLNGIIPGLIHLEVGINVTASDSGDDSDVILYSEFENMEALNNYYPHPAHVKIVPFAQSIRTERRVIDYEV